MIEMIALIIIMTATTVTISSIIHTRLKRIEQKADLYYPAIHKELFEIRNLQSIEEVKPNDIICLGRGATDCGNCEYAEYTYPNKCSELKRCLIADGKIYRSTK